MFTTDFIIDAVQNSKKQFVNTFVQNDAIRNALNDFVDGQTAYTKAAVKVATEVNTRITEEASKSFGEFSQFNINNIFKS